MKVYVIFFTKYVDETKNESFYKHEHKIKLIFLVLKNENFNLEHRTALLMSTLTVLFCSM